MAVARQMEVEMVGEEFGRPEVKKGSIVEIFSEGWAIRYPFKVVFVKNQYEILVDLMGWDKIRPIGCSVSGWRPDSSDIECFGCANDRFYWWVDWWRIYEGGEKYGVE